MDDLFLAPNDLVSVEYSGGRIVVRFISPQTRNPLSSEVLELLDKVVAYSESEIDIQALIFTGTDDVFASGADLREILALDPEAAHDFAIRGQTLMGRISALRLETVAAINGYCFGGALDLALACKRRIALANATFCHPGVGLGIIAGWGGTQRLPRLVGAGAASEMFFTTEPISSAKALVIGLIDAIDDAFVEAI